MSTKETITSRQRISIDGFPVSEAEIAANFPQGTQLKHLYTVEFHARRKIVNGCHFNERSDIRAIQFGNKIVVVEGVEDAIEVLTDWMDLHEDNKSERVAVLDQVKEMLSENKLKPGCYVKMDMNGLFDEDLLNVTMIVACDLGAADETGDTLAEFEKNWIG